MYQDHLSDGYLQHTARVLELVKVDRLPCNVVAHCRGPQRASESE
jgi:hypothetical protein